MGRTTPLRPVLIIGRTGQIARALVAVAAGHSSAIEIAGRPEADLAAPKTLKTLLDRVRPRIVVNAAAYTAVDRAESVADIARAVNATGPAELASLCSERAIPLIHLSTDYVFAGTAATPYRPDHAVDPQSVYGRTKAEGEDAIRNRLDCHLILRTAWVYDERGRNFLRAMLQAGAERDRLSVVNDQRGAPTYAADVARAIHAMMERIDRDGAVPWGTYHLTNSGETTWFGFAQAIFASFAEKGMRTPQLVPITTADYPTPARRPAYSVLDMSETERVLGIVMPDWRDGLQRCLARVDLSEFAYGEAVQ